MVVTPKNLTGTPTSNSILWQWEAGDEDLYPLDSISGAVAAFSLKQLKTGATACVDVRRSSDNAEETIGFSGGALDTTALLNHCGAGDGFIRRWHDQSGNGHNAYQSTTGSQPQIVASGVYLGHILSVPGKSLNIAHTDAFLIENAITIFKTVKLVNTGNQTNSWGMFKSSRYFDNTGWDREERFTLRIDGSERISSMGILSSGIRRHLTHTYNSSVQDMLSYIDGVLNKTTTLSGLASYTIVTSTTDLTVARSATTGTGGREDQYENVMLFNVALTGTQINTIIDYYDPE